MSTADRGKKLEADFRKVCKVYADRANFEFHRFPDAKSGSLVVAPADFQTLYASKFRLVECKEVSFDNRLPYKNFSPDQVARMRKWQLAGGASWVLISHTEAKLYRVLPAEFFKNRPDGQASWFFEEVTGFVTNSLEEAFKYIHGM